MKNLLLTVTGFLFLVSCAAKTEAEVPQAGANSGPALQTNEFSSLQLFRDKDATQALRLGDYFTQANAKPYVIYQFASVTCATCPAETRAMRQMMDSGGSQTADHFVVMVSANNNTNQQLQSFFQEAQASTSLMLTDRTAETTRLLQGVNWQTPYILVMGRNGVVRQFKASDGGSASINEVRSIISQ